MRSRMDGKPPTREAARNVVLALFGQVKKNIFFLFFHIYEKCGLERNNLEMVTQDEASIEPSASSYEGHEERGAV